MAIMLRFRKLPPDHPERALFGGILLSTHRNADPHYLAVLVNEEDGVENAIPIARIERETMGGCGINMWGSRYRWCVEMRNREWDEYCDTLADAKAYVTDRVFTLLCNTFGVTVNREPEPAPQGQS